MPGTGSIASARADANDHDSMLSIGVSLVVMQRYFIATHAKHAHTHTNAHEALDFCMHEEQENFNHKLIQIGDLPSNQTYEYDYIKKCLRDRSTTIHDVDLGHTKSFTFYSISEQWWCFGWLNFLVHIQCA